MVRVNGLHRKTRSGRFLIEKEKKGKEALSIPALSGIIGTGPPKETREQDGAPVPSSGGWRPPELFHFLLTPTKLVDIGGDRFDIGLAQTR